MRRFYYIGTLLFVFFIPTLVAGYFLSNYVSFNALIPFVALVTVIGSIWDVWATKHGRNDRVWLWQFNHRDTLGPRLLGLPMEEYLFYVLSSVYVIFMWEGMKLMVEGTDPLVYWTIAGLAGWTLLCIFIPYALAPKGDRIIG